MIKPSLYWLLLVIGGLFSPIVSGQVLYPINQNNRWGFIDSNGKEVVPCEYDFTSKYAKKFALAKKGNDLTVFYNAKNFYTIENCNTVSELKHPYYKAHIKNHWWIVDSAGNKISSKSYDQLWFVNKTDSLLYGINGKITSIVTLTGVEITSSSLSNFRMLKWGVYSAMLPSRYFVALNNQGTRILPDSFVRLLPTQWPSMIEGVRQNGERVFFKENGEILTQGKNIRYALFDNDYIQFTNSAKGNLLYDCILNTVENIKKAHLENCSLENCVIISFKGNNDIHSRYEGKPRKLATTDLKIVAGSNPIIFILNKKYGLMDSGRNIILTPEFEFISFINKTHLSVKFSFANYAIFNCVSGLFESKPIYQEIYGDSDYCKAYLDTGGMDYIRFGDSGKIVEKNYIAKIKRAKVYSRISDKELIDILPSIAGSGTRLYNGRSACWFGQMAYSAQNKRTEIHYGLYRSKGDRIDTLIRPVYTYYKMLKVAPWSIAGTRYFFKSAGIKLQGNQSYQNGFGHTIVNDTNGRRVPYFMQYIDETDLLNEKCETVRVYFNSKMALINKNNLKANTFCTYISPLECGKTRRLYVGGAITGLPKGVTEMNRLDQVFY